MMASWRTALLALLALTVATGCPGVGPEQSDGGSDSGVVSTPDAGGDAGLPGGEDAGGTSDAGEDGGLSLLPEEGDYLDEGPFAGCGLLPGGEGGACGTQEGYDLSGCDTTTLAALEPDGTWTTHVRSEGAEGEEADFFVSNLTLSSDGGREYLDRGYPVRSKAVGPTSFFVGYDRQYADGGTRVRSYVGCEAQGPGRVRGCYASCVNGQPAWVGTFEAVKVEPLPEAQAEGLALVSETVVGLGLPVDVYVTKDRAYVVSVYGGLTVVDVRDPTAPQVTAEETAEGDDYWNGVWAKGDALYVASGSSGVRVYDISVPDVPVFKSALPGGRLNVHTVFVEGNLLYAMATSTNEVLIYDVSEPLAPVLRARHQVPGASTTPGAYPHDSFAYEGRLYTFHWSLGMQVSDVREPSSPRVLGAWRHPRSTSHAGAVGRYGERLIAFEGGEDWGAHVRVLDVTDPGDIRKLGEWGMRPEVSIHNMLLDEATKQLWIAYYQDGVRVLDVSVPEQPRKVAHFNTWRPWQPGRGQDFYEGAIGIRRPRAPDVTQEGLTYVVDTQRGLLILREE